MNVDVGEDKLHQMTLRNQQPSVPATGGQVSVRKRVDSELQDFSPKQRAIYGTLVNLSSWCTIIGFAALVTGINKSHLIGPPLSYWIMLSGLAALAIAFLGWCVSTFMNSARENYIPYYLDLKQKLARAVPPAEELHYLAVPSKRTIFNSDVYAITEHSIFYRSGKGEFSPICELRDHEQLHRNGNKITLPDGKGIELDIVEEYVLVAQKAMQMPTLPPKQKQTYSTLMDRLGHHRRVNSGLESALTLLPKHIQEQEQDRGQWPTPQDFNESIQTPRVSFNDAVLKACVPQLNPMGLPMPVTGAFASVYKLLGEGHSWAVKCFLREVQDQALRYRLISDCIRNSNLSCAIGFEFIEHGISVRNHLYPVVKMDWVEGASILDFIDAHLHDADALEHIADDFMEMHLALAERGIAHGDLQHGNIIITENGLKLVDYDGMYVHGMSGFVSNELGHRNYQHPQRDALHFGPYIDNFSVWVIYLSLKILAIAPELWDETGRGDECLIFKQHDFANPNQSTVFNRLLTHGHPDLKKYWVFLSKICQDDFANVPAPSRSPDIAALLQPASN